MLGVAVWGIKVAITLGLTREAKHGNRGRELELDSKDNPVSTGLCTGAA